MFGLIGSVKFFSKVPGVGMNVAPYMAYVLYIYICLILYTKKGVLGFHNSIIISLWLFFFAILAIKMAEFLKTIFEN